MRIVGLRSTAPRAGTDPVLDQRSCEFVPPVVVVPVGGKLTFTSSDPVLHNTHAIAEGGSTPFNLAVQIKGMKLSWKATTPGILRVKCDAGHTWISASIIVAENSFYAVTNVAGNFIIRDVPDGTYTVEAWHPVLGKLTQTVKVDSKGSSISYRFTGK